MSNKIKSDIERSNLGWINRKPKSDRKPGKFHPWKEQDAKAARDSIKRRLEII